MKQYSFNIFLAIILFAAGLVIADLAPANAQSRGDMESLAEQAIIVWNTGNTAIADQIFSPDFTFQYVDNKDPEISPEMKGTAKLIDHINWLRKAYPDMKFKVDHINVDGDEVIARVTFTGTNMGPRGDMPPTGKKVELSTAWFFKIKDGVIVEQLFYANLASVYDQLGFTLTPPSQEK